MPSKYTDEIENASDTWRVFLYGKKIKIFTPAKVNGPTISGVDIEISLSIPISDFCF